MWFETMLDLNGAPGRGGLFFAAGSFGVIDGGKTVRTAEDRRTVFTLTAENVTLRASFEVDESGVTVRRDTLTNTSDAPILLNAFFGRFRPDGSRYEVYTQFNGWQHESTGGWSDLVTQTVAAAEGIRTCDGAAPLMALHNLTSDRTAVFHLVPNAQWKMIVRRTAATNGAEFTVLETGFENTGLCLTVAPGETVSLPTVLFFPVENRLDLDAYKLHTYWNRRFPRRKTPVLYNSWLYCFDQLDVDALLRQVDAAADLGIEAFMIDAGWFGKGEKDWFNSVGDWEENTKGGPCGRLSEIAERVHAHGMMFGLWFEPERAAQTSRAMREHPDFYFGGSFIDFANPAAREFLTGKIAAQILKYGIDWVKFDFNDTMPTDPTGGAFYHYLEGQRLFITGLRERFPDLYITDCASGGQRMELGQAEIFDSFWPSDNEGPLDEMRILKDTFKRMPPAAIEHWNVQNFGGDFSVYAGIVRKEGFMFTCDGATWDHAVKVSDSFTGAFLTGGPIGFSCDVEAIPDEWREKWRAMIARFKEDRDLWQNVTARILCDADGILALEYADADLDRCVVQVYTSTTFEPDLTVFPALDPTSTYRHGDAVLPGKQILEEGIRVGLPAKNGCVTFSLIKE